METSASTSSMCYNLKTTEEKDRGRENGNLVSGTAFEHSIHNENESATNSGTIFDSLP